ncbi:MAG: GreA/GreB family elongation factor [Thermoanaerobaculia bacterium]
MPSRRRQASCSTAIPFAFQAWFALERSGHLPADAGWSIDDLFGSPVAIRKLLSGLEDRLLRERALTMLKERREDWPAIHLDHFQREADPRVLSLIAEGLERESPDDLQKLLESLIAKPKKSPAAFVWLAERAADNEAIRDRLALRLLQQILTTLASSDLAPYRARLKALVESGGTIPRLLSHLAPEQAGAAMEAVARCSALDTFHKEPLKNAILLRFPSLREESNETLYAVASSIEGTRAELKQLTEVEIPANRKAIEEARAMGDLRENFEYKSARERHEYLNARLAALHRDLGRARPIDFSGLDLSEVRIGCRVELQSDGTASRRIAVLGPWESQPEEGILSYESELGKVLLGRKIGDEVTIAEESFVVRSIAPADDVSPVSLK